LDTGGTDFDLQAAINFTLAALNVPVMLNSCENIGDDLHALENWAKIFEEPEKLSKTISKNYLLHRKAIKEDIASFKSDWATQDYFKAGINVADLLTLAIGPIDDTPVMLE
jgi:hypothetical protein